MLQIKDFCCGYPNCKDIVRNVSLDLKSDAITALIGCNGAGKSTLLKGIMGILKAQQGELLFLEKDITKVPTFKRFMDGIGYVPQGRDIFPYLTVEENLLLGLDAKGKGAKEKKIASEKAFNYFEDLYGIRKRKGGLLSGGQQQQLAIARVLVTDPKILILDEPTEGIQPSIVKQIGRILADLTKDLKVTILLVEQYISFAINLSSRYYVMEAGMITQSGDVNSDEEKQKVIEKINI